MLGIIFGTVCVLGLVRMVVRRRRWMGRGGRFYGHFHRSWGHFGPRAMLGRLFRRLDTTPEQERAILGLFEKTRERMRAVKLDAGEARREVASALRSESFDEVLLGSAQVRFEAAVEAARKSFVDAFAQLHSILDEHQRTRLADFVEHGRARGARWSGLDDVEDPLFML